MLSYKHGYHAGNHADVLKHLCLIEAYRGLKRLHKSINYIDTHAGSGKYVYKSDYMSKNKEYLIGIEKIVLFNSENQQIRSYLKIIRNINNSKKLFFYPGSPIIINHLSDNLDKLFFYELQNTEVKLLKKNIKNTTNAKIYQADGFNFINKKMNLNEQFLILIDPSYEIKDDFQKVINLLKLLDEKYKNFTVLTWYPVLSMRNNDDFIDNIRRLGLTDIIRIELPIKTYDENMEMKGSGILIMNSNKLIYQNFKKCIYELFDILKDSNCKTNPKIKYIK